MTSRSRLIRLTGNVVLTKDANVMRGNALEVSMATGLARLTADAAQAAPGQPTGPRAGPVRARARSRQGGAATSGKSRE